jgi:hypothetical protein
MSIAQSLWKQRRERPLLLVLTAVTIASMVCWPVVQALFSRYDVVHVATYGFNDFGAYAYAVDHWISGDAPIYTRNEGGGFHGSYLYPPHVLPLFYPFSIVEFYTGANLFGFASLVVLWFGILAVGKELGYEPTIPERLVGFVALFGFHPALWDFKWGQISTLLAGLLCFAFYTHERGRRGHAGSQFLSGVLTTLAASVKLFYATAGAHMLRDSRRFVGGMLTGVGLIASSLLVFGWETHRLYLDVLRWGKGWGTGQLPPRDWQTAYYRPLYLFDQLLEKIGLTLPDTWMIVATVIGIAGVIGLVVMARSVPDGTDLAFAPASSHLTFALGVAVIPLLAPRAYTHDLVVLLLPAVILLAVELEHDGYPWLPVLAVLLIQFHSFGTKAIVTLLGGSWAVLLQPGVYGTLILVGLASGRLVQVVRTAR